MHIKYLSIVFFSLFYLLLGGLEKKNLYAQPINEEEMKSSYLFNFPKYVEWPENNGSTFTIGVYGISAPNDHILSKMAEIINAKSQSRQYQIVHFYIGEPIEDVKMLYVPEIERSEQVKLLKKLKNKPILTVGNNIPHFCEDGGIMNFLPMKNPKPFCVNIKAAKNAGITISPKLIILSELYNKRQ